MVEKVYAVGGSTIKQNFEQLDEVAESLEQEDQVVAVVVGGHLKKHQEAVRGHCNKGETDLVGITATRLNARTLQALIDNVAPQIPETIQEVREAASSGQNVVMGGLNPGFSTDAVAAVVAELYNAELYLFKDVKGIYTEDPDKNPEAEALSQIEVKKLLEMTSGRNKPGVYSIVDETAVKIIQRSEIPTKVIKGKIKNLKNPKKAKGTNIVGESF